MAKPKTPKHRCHPDHKRLEAPRFSKRVSNKLPLRGGHTIKPRKGKGAYRRGQETGGFDTIGPSAPLDYNTDHLTPARMRKTRP